MRMLRLIIALSLLGLCQLHSTKPSQAQDRARENPPGKGAAAGKKLDPHETLVQKLQQPINVDFVETPLKDVIAFVADSLQVKIVIDAKSLEEAAVSLDVPITKSMQDLPADAFLKLLLNELDLAMVRREGFLQISTPAKLETEIELRTYPIRDLPGIDADDQDVQPAIEMIQKMVEPSSWRAHGPTGIGDIVRLQTILVIRQTPMAHDQIADLLRQTRRALAESQNAE